LISNADAERLKKYIKDNFRVHNAMSSKYTSYGIVVTVGPAVFVFFIIGSAQYATALGELVSSLSDVRLSSTKIVQISANQSQKSPATATFTND
jgi:hypothetical protein